VAVSRELNSCPSNPKCIQWRAVRFCLTAPARLMRACENLHNNNLMFDCVVHINTDALKACYQAATASDSKTTDSQRRVMKHIEDGRLISLDRWFRRLLGQ